MVEPSQVMVQKYFELKGYFLQANVKFPVPRNYSDIDLIGIDSHGDGLVVEVKSWGQQDIGVKDGKELVDELSSNKARLRKIKEVLGEQRKVRKVLVLARIGKQSNRKLRDYAESRDVEVLTLDGILKELLESLPSNPSYENEVLQVLRMLKIYTELSKVKISFTHDNQQ